MFRLRLVLLLLRSPKPLTVSIWPQKTAFKRLMPSNKSKMTRLTNLIHWSQKSLHPSAYRFNKCSTQSMVIIRVSMKINRVISCTKAIILTTRCSCLWNLMRRYLSVSWRSQKSLNRLMIDRIVIRIWTPLSLELTKKILGSYLWNPMYLHLSVSPSQKNLNQHMTDRIAILILRKLSWRCPLHKLSQMTKKPKRRS